jgi:hypothetical protein
MLNAQENRAKEAESLEQAKQTNDQDLKHLHNAREPPRCPQRPARCVAMWCDAQRRVAERCDAPRRAALPTVMSISPTRLID